MIAEWFARAPTAHVLVRSCRRFEEQCSKQTRCVVKRTDMNTNAGPSQKVGQRIG
jgi:hypothetical protein